MYDLLSLRAALEEYASIIVAHIHIHTHTHTCRQTYTTHTHTYGHTNTYKTHTYIQAHKHIQHTHTYIHVTYINVKRSRLFGPFTMFLVHLPIIPL